MYNETVTEILMTLEERDAILEDLWDEFLNTPLDTDREIIEDDFLDFPHGTKLEEIWDWFDQRYSKGVYYLLYNDGVDRTSEIAKLTFLHQLCQECDSKNCCFNNDGECHYALVHETQPRITDEDGCFNCECSSL